MKTPPSTAMMQHYCEKCHRREQEHLLEITLIRICSQCYRKILISRILSQTKRMGNDDSIIIHDASYSFFGEDDAKKIFNAVIGLQYQRAVSHHDSKKDNRHWSMLIATKEAVSMMLLECLSAAKEDNEHTKEIMLGIGNKSIIIPLLQFSLKELNIFMGEDSRIGLRLNGKYSRIEETLKEMERTHKDATSGLSKSFIQLSEMLPEN